MRKLLAATIIAACAIGPISARAGEQPILAQQAAPAPSIGFDSKKAFAIGAGIVIGATAGSIVSLRGASIVGGVAGGLIGAWWYGDKSEYATLEPRKK